MDSIEQRHRGYETFGRFIKRLRTARGVTLRAFCQEHGFDHGNFSRLERGVLAPPQKEEKLAEYAAALGIERGTDEWLEFCDLAAVRAARSPRTSSTTRQSSAGFRSCSGRSAIRGPTPRNWMSWSRRFDGAE